jgi:hypothetical protein
MKNFSWLIGKISDAYYETIIFQKNEIYKFYMYVMPNTRRIYLLYNKCIVFEALPTSIAVFYVAN